MGIKRQGRLAVYSGRPWKDVYRELRGRITVSQNRARIYLRLEIGGSRRRYLGVGKVLLSQNRCAGAVAKIPQIRCTHGDIMDAQLQRLTQSETITLQ